MTQKPFSYTINLYLSIGAFFCMLALIFSSLTSHLPAAYFANGGREMSRIADNILLVQGLAMIVLAIIQRLWKPSIHLLLIGIFFILGSLLFCTGVYYVALTGNHPFAPIAPTGGSMLILGWLYLAITALFLK